MLSRSTNKHRKNKKRQIRDHAPKQPSQSPNKKGRNQRGPEDHGDVEDVHALMSHPDAERDERPDSARAWSPSPAAPSMDGNGEGLPELARALREHRESAFMLFHSFSAVMNKFNEEFLYLLRWKLQVEEEEDRQVLNACEDGVWIRIGLSDACKTISSRQQRGSQAASTHSDDF